MSCRFLTLDSLLSKFYVRSGCSRRRGDKDVTHRSLMHLSFVFKCGVFKCKTALLCKMCLSRVKEQRGGDSVESSALPLLCTILLLCHQQSVVDENLLLHCQNACMSSKL